MDERRRHKGEQTRNLCVQETIAVEIIVHAASERNAVNAGLCYSFRIGGETLMQNEDNNSLARIIVL
jgi:hypothetical protein